MYAVVSKPMPVWLMSSGETSAAVAAVHRPNLNARAPT